MKKALKALVLGTILAAAGAAQATPSTTYWTPATTYVQPYLVPHLTYDTYFAEKGSYAVDTGLTMGILPFEKLQAEIGFDLNLGGPVVPFYAKSGFLLNAKLGVPEGAFGEMFPGISAGIFGVGFQSSSDPAKGPRSDYNILHAEIGKTFSFGNFTVGGYLGNDKVLVDENLKKAASGLIASYTSPDIKIGLPGLDKLLVIADVQTGKSAFGAAGGGLALYFTPAIDLITGPVFFLNDKTQVNQTSWMWTMQIDVDVELLAKPKT
jgi:hypothetical protein